MEIKSFDEGIFAATTYLCYDPVSLDGVIVDCTCCMDKVKKEIDDKKINLKYILITHGHFDHVYCIKKANELFSSIPVLMNENDMPLLNQVPIQCGMAGVDGIDVPKIDKFINSNSDLKLGDKKIQVIETPGHSEGGNCYLIDNNLFSGDTLFKGSIGRCDLYGGSMEKIATSIVEKLFTLNDDVTVYPGHGEPTTIGEEKLNNSYFGKNR